MILGTGSVSWFEMQNLSCSCLQTTSPLSSPIRTLTSTHQPPLRWLCPALTVPPRAFPAPDPFSACALSLRIHLLPILSSLSPSQLSPLSLCHRALTCMLALPTGPFEDGGNFALLFPFLSPHRQHSARSMSEDLSVNLLP